MPSESGPGWPVCPLVSGLEEKRKEKTKVGAAAAAWAEPTGGGSSTDDLAFLERRLGSQADDMYPHVCDTLLDCELLGLLGQMKPWSLALAGMMGLAITVLSASTCLLVAGAVVAEPHKYPLLSFRLMLLIVMTLLGMFGVDVYID
ncbi:unnamed protein product [Polarella glacialis]|uniref:Uncharacterized protein n=1 Tax=Polarella glacialis TaxID=89957 RepID=A0A813L601_POLGL|nr:unnamed protein product [Polarella glacialis]